MEAKSKSKAFKIFLRYISLRGIFSPVALERARICRIHSIIHIKTKPLRPTTTILLTFKHLLLVLMSIHTKTRWRIALCLMTLIDCFQTLPNNHWRQIRLEYLPMGEPRNHNHESRILDSTWIDSRIWKRLMAGKDSRTSSLVSSKRRMPSSSMKMRKRNWMNPQHQFTNKHQETRQAQQPSSSQDSKRSWTGIMWVHRMSWRRRKLSLLPKSLRKWQALTTALTSIFRRCRSQSRCRQK